MASYFWVGGSGTWNASSTTNWATSSGGAGGAGFPTTADTVTFDANSGASPVITVSTAVCSACTIGAPTSGTLTLALGTSTLTMSGNMSITTSISVTGTGTISLSAAAPTFAGNGNTFYNISFTSTANGTIAISGANTFNNLYITGRSGNGLNKYVQIGANQIINGTLTLGTTNTGSCRLFVFSDVVGTQRTLTAATVATLSDVDFRDIAAAGVSSPWSGTRLGNGLNNSGITFPAPKTVYWNLAAGGNWSDGWAATPGGGVSSTNFPLIQDTATIQNAGLNTSATITIGSGTWNIGLVDLSGRSNAMTLNASTNAINIYKNFTLNSAISISGTGTWTFVGQGTTQQITSAGVSFTNSFNINVPNGTFQLQDNLTLGATLTFTFTSGNLHINNQTLSTGVFSSSNANTRSILFGASGQLNITGNAATVFQMSTATGFTYTGTSYVNLSYSGSTGTRTLGFTTGATESNVLNLNVTAGTDTLALSGASYRDLNFTGFSGTVSNSALTIYGSLTVSSGLTWTAGALAMTFAATSGSKTITTNTKTLDFPITFNGIGGTWVCQDALTLGATRALTMTNGTVKLKSGTTNTVGSFVTTGTNLKYLASSMPGSQATISDSSGVNSVSYLSIQDSFATGGATWDSFYSNGNLDAGNNTNWEFGESPVLGNEIEYELRSFTEHRRF